MKEVLEQDVLAGDRVEKRLIPREYIDEFGANHLYMYSHPEGYRSCYIIVEGCPRILDLINHNTLGNLDILNDLYSNVFFDEFSELFVVSAGIDYVIAVEDDPVLSLQIL